MTLQYYLEFSSGVLGKKYHMFREGIKKRILKFDTVLSIFDLETLLTFPYMSFHLQKKVGVGGTICCMFYVCDGR